MRATRDDDAAAAGKGPVGSVARAASHPIFPLAECPDELYSIMLQCWNDDHTARTPFSKLHAQVSAAATRHHHQLQPLPPAFPSLLLLVLG